MAKELLSIAENNTLEFGDYTLDSKTKVEGFEFQGDIYKVKSFKEITKLEKNGMFVYESVPGTKVSEFYMSDAKVSFRVCGSEDAQITVELEPKCDYKVCIADKEIGTMTTNISGKLSVGVELSGDAQKMVEIIKE